MGFFLFGEGTMNGMGENMAAKMEMHISVRGLVEFILRTGNIDNRKAVSPENAMQEGGRIHRMIQRRMGADYHAEVALKYFYETENYTVTVEGRADGIIFGNGPQQEEAPLLSGSSGSGVILASGNQAADDTAAGRSGPDNALTGYSVMYDKAEGNTRQEHPVTVDEIKGTYQEVKRMKEPAAVHLAQAKCYAYIYARQEHLEGIRVRMTYCNMDTEELKYFHYDYTFEELDEWFGNVMEQYRKWADFQYQWRIERQESIKGMQFPFAYREGQKNLVTYVYQTIYHRKKLFIEAPTGVGKTISTVFPAVKAIGEGKGERIFYLTAKTITRTVADDTFQILREKGLKFKTVILTAKDKICFMEETECNPDYCPYAKGHYDRINDAMYDMLTHMDNFSREKITEYGKKHKVCPFELCLDMSLFSDGIICDYNYVFDPHVYLKRFLAENSKGEYIFLVDEAHNLVERGREMYSAVMCKEDFLRLKKVIKGLDGKMEHWLEKCNKELLALKRECETYRIEEYIEPFVTALRRLHAAMDTYLEEHDGGDVFHTKEVRGEVLDFYFEVCHFLDIYERVDKNYVTYSEMREDGSFILKLFCVNPSMNLKECMKKGRSTILFSATLLPIAYYKDLLGAEEGDYEVYAQSVFDPSRKKLFIGSDVTSKYSRRTEGEYDNIALYIYEIVRNRYGNYLIFFPSHAFMQNIYQRFVECFAKQEEMECVMQEDYMDETSREEFLQRFSAEGEEKSLLGFKERQPDRGCYCGDRIAASMQ